jgi:hypothetical protein
MQEPTRQSIPPRTGATSLSDDELLLMDFLFNCSARIRFLRRQVYRIHMNVRYTHGLDDDALSCTLERNVKAGLFACRSFEGESVYSLTPEGGGMWEAERKPIWPQYVHDYGSRPTPSGVERVRVLSPEMATIESFLAIAEESRYYTDVPQRRRYRALSNYQLVPWKAFPTVHVVFIRLPKQSWPPLTNWKQFMESRTWWSHISDLVYLQQKSG